MTKSYLNISQILQTTKTLNEQKSKIYFFGIEIDYGVTFSKGCTSEQISDLEKHIGFSLPADYKQFLSYTNGMGLSSTMIGSHLFSVDMIYHSRKVIHRPSNFLVIGSCADGGYNIAINLEDNEEQNIYVVETIVDEYFSKFNFDCSFTTFLDMFITMHGLPFWQWKLQVTPHLS